MQFEPEESGEERRRRQRDYHAFLDAQVEARKHQPEDDVTTDRLPVLPLSARLKNQPGPPYGSGCAPKFPKQGEKARIPDGGSGLGDLDHRAEIANRNEHYSRLEQRLEAEVQRRYLVERKLSVLDQKVGNLGQKNRGKGFFCVKAQIGMYRVYCRGEGAHAFRWAMVWSRAIYACIV